MPRLKILFAATADPSSPLSWSGTPYYMARALGKFGHVENIHLRRPSRAVLAVAARVGTLARRSWVQFDRTPYVLRAYSRQLRDASARVNPDVIVSPSTLPFAYAKSDIPMISWTDAVYSQMVSYYPEFSGLSSGTVRRGIDQELRSLAAVVVAGYTSRWAAEEAIRIGADSGKVIVAPYGPNFDDGAAQRTCTVRRGNAPNLLFVGGDWERKGGYIAARVVSILRSRGLDATLTVVGAPPPCEIEHVTWMGVLNKNNPAELDTLLRLYRQASALILPTRADCTPVVITEAIRLGLPVLASRTGGVADLVESHASGAVIGQGIGEEERFADAYETLTSQIDLTERSMRRANLAASTLDYTASFERILARAGLT